MENHTLICVIGDSQAGKSALITWAARQYFPELRIIRSVTTRSRKSGESREEFKLFYRRIAVSTFLERTKVDYFVEYDEYAGNWYGTAYQELKTLQHSCGIQAVTEPAIPRLREMGIPVYVIRVERLAHSRQEISRERCQADQLRRGTVTPDKVVPNDFSAGGFKRSCQRFGEIIEPLITG